MERNSKRISILLTDDAAELLAYLASSQGISKSEAIRKALATESYLLQQRQEGSKVLLQTPDNKLREVVFR